MAYEEGTLEIMSPSNLHETIKRIIGRFIETFTEVLDIDIRSAGSTTFKLEARRRGFEADESYYIQQEAAVRGSEEIDLGVDPPPDLVLEVDLSRSSFGKLGIYWSLQVPEVWLYDGRLRIYRRNAAAEGRYDEEPRSTVLVQLEPSVVERFLDQRRELSETELLRSFRAWVCATFGAQ